MAVAYNSMLPGILREAPDVLLANTADEPIVLCFAQVKKSIREFFPIYEAGGMRLAPSFYRTFAHANPLLFSPHLPGYPLHLSSVLLRS